MKKLLRSTVPFLLVLALMLFSACGSSGPSGGSGSGGNIQGSVEEILQKVSDGAADPEVFMMTAEVNDDNFSWYFFIDPIAGAEGMVSEPGIGSIPHFIGVLRVPSSEDPETVRGNIEKNVDLRKWVCVEAEKAAVVRHGDVILLAMSTPEYVDKAVANFDALAK